MRSLKNAIVGVVVSFIGSIPLGYLNIIGFEIYSEFGSNKLIHYLLGVITVEVVVIYLTLHFAKKLVDNKRLMKVIDCFGVLFLLALAYSFYSHANQVVEQQTTLDKYLKLSPFLLGVVLNCINFLQFPFWTGWNLYLMNGNYISVEKRNKFYYLFGAAIGTFSGMYGLVLALNSISQKTTFFSNYIMPVFIPIFFIVLAIIQMFKCYNRYFKSNVADKR